jgi:hypothetical protein
MMPTRALLRRTANGFRVAGIPCSLTRVAGDGFEERVHPVALRAILISNAIALSLNQSEGNVETAKNSS